MKNIIENHYSKPTDGLGLNIIYNLISPLRSWLLFGLMVFFSHTSFSQNFSLDDYNYYPGPHFNLLENLGGISRIADMDNDGLEDLVVFGESTTDGGAGIYAIWIYYQTANPDHWEVEEVSRLSSSFSNYNSNHPILELADIDSDGDIDILGLEPFKGENLRWFKNAGNRSFVMDSSFVIYYPNQVFIEDMDNDGDLDIVYSIFRDFGLYLNNGNGSFQLDTLNSFERLEGFLAVGDLDGDNYKDILIGGEPDQSNKDTIIIYRGHPSGLYGSIGLPNFILDNPVGFLQDLDADGDLDIIIQAQEGWWFSQLLLYENNGIGQFNKHILVNDNSVFRGLGLNYANNGGLFFHDIVGDSLVDIIYQSNQIGLSKVFENKGSNVFTVSQSLPFNLLSGFISFSEGDLDNDGADELVKIHKRLNLDRAPGDHVKIEVY
jgi:hypothetical protein